MPGVGPASTPCGVEAGERRGWWAFAHHDGKRQPAAFGHYFIAYGEAAGFPGAACPVAGGGARDKGDPRLPKEDGYNTKGLAEAWTGPISARLVTSLASPRIS